MELYSTLVERQPGVPEYRNSLGIVCVKLKQHGSAIEQFQQAIGLNPNEPNFYLNLSRAYQRVGDIEKAKAAHHTYRQLKMYAQSDDKR